MCMKQISTLLLFLLTLLTGYAQNPFATYGYKPQMATLSNGRFDEFHDKDQIIEIGSVKFDTKTNKIVGPAESDTLDTVMDIQTVSRFISIDPHAERYYSISPYAYCNNNPVNCIDPDGRDWYRHNETGNYYWQEGHDELEGYTNIGASVSIQLGEDSYFNAYQNAGIMANQAVSAFSLISSSGKLQNQFLGKNSPLSENSKSELFNALNSRNVDEIARPIGETVTYLLTGEAAGIFAGKAISWGIGKIAGHFFSNTNKVADAVNLAKQWLGIDAKVIQNAKGDYVFISKDGLRKIRFDINSPHGDAPHIHLEILKNGKWKNAIPRTHRIYPQ